MSDIQYTRRQLEYLAFISQYCSMIGVPPSEGDIAHYFSVSGPSAHQMVVTLEKKGAISKIPGEARSLQVLDRPTALPVLGWEGSEFICEEQPGPGRNLSAVIEFAEFLAYRICSKKAMEIARMSAVHRLSRPLCAGLRKRGLSETFVSSLESYLNRLPWLHRDTATPVRAAAQERHCTGDSRREAREAERRSHRGDPRQGVLF